MTGKTLTRINSMGRPYNLYALSENETAILVGKKRLVVPHKLEHVDQAWYNWMVGGYPIQQAFNFMSADAREFILTGITPEEWDELFPEKDEE